MVVKWPPCCTSPLFVIHHSTQFPPGDTQKENKTGSLWVSRRKMKRKAKSLGGRAQKVSWCIVWRSEYSLVLEEVETYESWSQRKQTNKRSWGVNRSNQINVKDTYLWLNSGTAEEYMLLQPLLIHIQDVSYLFPLNLSVCLIVCLSVIVCLSDCLCGATPRRWTSNQCCL